MRGNPAILVADDNADDAIIVAEAFERAGASGTVHFVREGDEAINYLQGHGAYGNRAQFPFPRLFVLDLCLPGTSGFELLAWTRRQPWLDRVVVGVLSGMEYEPDIQKALALGAQFYITKPCGFNDWVEIARQLIAKCGAGISL